MKFLSQFSFGYTRAGRSGFYGSIPGGGWECSLQNRVQNGSAAHPASYPTGTMGSFLGG